MSEGGLRAGHRVGCHVISLCKHNIEQGNIAAG